MKNTGLLAIYNGLLAGNNGLLVIYNGLLAGLRCGTMGYWLFTMVY